MQVRTFISLYGKSKQFIFLAFDHSSMDQALLFVSMFVKHYKEDAYKDELRIYSVDIDGIPINICAL